MSTSGTTLDAIPTLMTRRPSPASRSVAPSSPAVTCSFGGGAFLTRFDRREWERSRREHTCERCLVGPLSSSDVVLLFGLRWSFVEQRVSVDLSVDEALVLYDWLRRFNQTRSAAFEDQAEERVLWDVEALLEKMLTAPVVTDYRERLTRARNIVRDSVD